jgi:hypothetical protein
MKYFRSSMIVTLLGFVIAFLFLGGASALYVVILLFLLEVTLSFDNAVVNAKVLETMEPKWQQRFITYGIPVAVFGMRFLFPIMMVSFASHMVIADGGIGIWNTFQLAMYAPESYQDIFDKVHHIIYAFGGAFLLMVFLDFLFDSTRDVKWIDFIEDNSFIKKIATAEHTETVIALAIGLTLVNSVDTKIGIGVALAYFTGIILHLVLITFDELLNSNGVRSGIVGLLYLEVLDASFSFDGVIGAFALSSNIFIIMIGLGIGAMFVRSLTLYMVEKKTLDAYKYLEHGAHYAIFALAVIMFCKMFIEVNEILVGTIGILFVGMAVVHSIIEKRKEG